MNQLLLSLLFVAGGAASPMTVSDLTRVKQVSDVRISPDGERVAYRLAVPRDPYKSPDGPPWVELHVTNTQSGDSRSYIHGEVAVKQYRWRPDGSAIGYIAKRQNDEYPAIYEIPVDGGESRRLFEPEQPVRSFAYNHDGTAVYFLAAEKRDKTKKKLRSQGFDAEVYEEDVRPIHVWRHSRGKSESKLVSLPGSASSLEHSPVEDLFAVALAPSPLIDDQYMNRTIHFVAGSSGEILGRINHRAKLGPIQFSPDGKHIAFIAGIDENDPKEGRLYLAHTKTQKPRHLLPDFAGHLFALCWLDNQTVGYVAHTGTETILAHASITDGSGHTMVHTHGQLIDSLSTSRDGRLAYAMQSWSHPAEVFYRDSAGKTRRLTHHNQWLAERTLAKQQSIEFTARDGVKLQGVYLPPIGRSPKGAPLVLMVHGGPESLARNGWVTNYSRPAQVMAGAGYGVLFPNYRGSIGRGVEFSKMGQSDYAGAEFDDLVDAAEHLVKAKGYAPNKVGITGGSYGGFATAWAATKLTKHFQAGVMFVGISEHISKAGTTDIPTEMYLVHSRRWPWQHWDWFRERSPLYHVEQSRTPLLIMHGKNDTRVDKSQSVQLYRYLKLLGRVPTRLVLYPKEGHGNRRAASRLDFSHRLIRWFDHFLREKGKALPPWQLPHNKQDLDRLLKTE